MTNGDHKKTKTHKDKTRKTNTNKNKTRKTKQEKQNNKNKSETKQKTKEKWREGHNETGQVFLVISSGFRFGSPPLFERLEKAKILQEQDYGTLKWCMIASGTGQLTVN